MPKILAKLLPVLALLLPDKNGTLFAGACVVQGSQCQTAWAEWCRRTGDPEGYIRNNGADIKRLGPILYENLKKNRIELGDRFLTYLRAARLREEIRSEAFRGILADVLSLLTRNNIQFVLLRGSVLNETVYPAPGMRHCHDIDIRLDNSELTRAICIFENRGWPVRERNRTSAIVRHESGMRICLHRTWFSIPGYEEFVQDSAMQRVRCTGNDIVTLSRESMLVHVLGHAATGGGRTTLLWICDALHLITASPVLDWKQVSSCIERGRLALPLSVLFRFLKDMMNAPVPSTFMERLDAALQHTTRTDFERALAGLRNGAHISLRNVFKSVHSAGARLFLAGLLLMPGARSKHQLSFRWRGSGEGQALR